MAEIFISYRRDDAAGHAGRLYDQLVEDFGETHVFMDVDAIDPGADFVERIEAAVGAADAFIAVIGRNWTTARDGSGARRLEDPNDYVRREIGAALRRDIAVIPVLVSGAAMPSAADLPPELAPLARRNALSLSDLDWRGGVARLVATLRKTLRGEQPTPTPPPPTPRPQPAAEPTERAPPAALAAGIAGAGMVVLATLLRWDRLVDPDFGGGTVPNLGAAVAPASVAVAAGAVLAVLLAWRRNADALATGLVLGVGIDGAAKYAALYGQAQSQTVGPDQFGSDGSLFIGLAGSLVLLALGVFWLVRRHREQLYYRVVGRVFAILGAALMTAATLVPFNVSFPESRSVTQVIVERDEWEAFEPLAVAAAVLLAAILGRWTRQALVSGLFLALGILAAPFWLRYFGVPLLQMLERDDLASVRAGGFVGLAGALLVWRAGVVGRRSVLERHE